MATHYLQLDNQDFITAMRRTPHRWGSGSHNTTSCSYGEIQVFNDLHEYQLSYYFDNTRVKKDKVAAAGRQIKNLKGWYLVYSFGV